MAVITRNHLWGGGHNCSQVCPVAPLGVGTIASILWRRHFHYFSELEVLVSELSLFLFFDFSFQSSNGDVHFHYFSRFTVSAASVLTVSAETNPVDPIGGRKKYHQACDICNHEH